MGIDGIGPKGLSSSMLKAKGPTPSGFAASILRLWRAPSLRGCMLSNVSQFENIGKQVPP